MTDIEYSEIHNRVYEVLKYNGILKFRDNALETALIEAVLAANSQEPEATCSKVLRLEGKPYGRSCKKCKLGPCTMQQDIDFINKSNLYAN